MTGLAVRWSPLLLLALLWEAASRLGVISPDVLPPLSRIALAVWTMTRSGELPANAAASLVRLVAGLAMAVAGGILLGLLMAWYRPPRLVFAPILRVLYPLPKTALIPVLLLWFGLGDLSKVMLIFLGCLLPVVLSTFNGVRGVDRTMIWSARSLGCSNLRALFGIGLAAALPEILAGLRTALALSFILVVTSEFLMANNGLGYMISYLGSSGAYSAMFAAVLVVALLGFAADRLFLRISHRVLAWRD
jgi:NitT/TauT family transport system permease protein